MSGHSKQCVLEMKSPYVVQAVFLLLLFLVYPPVSWDNGCAAMLSSRVKHMLQ